MYSFREGVPDNFQFDFEVGIFHQKPHLLLQSPQGLISFAMVDEVDETVKGLIHFHIHESFAWSPLRSMYGSYIFSNDISEKQLSEFVNFAETKLLEKGIRSIILKNPPKAYSPQHKLLERVLHQYNYKIDLEEISAIIPVTDQPFESGLHRSEKYLLRKSRKSDLAFEMLSSDHLPVIYEFLRACKEKKGYEISMTYHDLQKLMNTFPDSLFLTQVVQSDKLIAAGVSIKVNESVLYNFYVDHDDSFDIISPVIFLIEGLYGFCQNSGIDVFDLGTSTVQRKVKQSLLNFKLRLGAFPTPKITFVKNFS